MKKIEIKAKVRETVLVEHFLKTGEMLIPVAVSNRHIHLTEASVEKLFGAGHRLTFRNDLFQTGQFACAETVTLKGPKGQLKNVRVLGPERSDDQAEISISDSYILGVPAVIRLSGDTEDTPGVTVIGPAGELSMDHGVIVAERHCHFSTYQARVFGVKNGDELILTTKSLRPSKLCGVKVRVNDKFELEAHVDMDEANGACINNDMLLPAEVVPGRKE